MSIVWQGVDLLDVYNGKVVAANYMTAHYMAQFFYGPIGENYGLGINDKIALFNAFGAHAQDVHSLTGNGKHLNMAAMILALDPAMKGDLVECGAYKGSSAISLSHLAQATGRRLIVCDSFQGLPPDCDLEMVLPHYNFTSHQKPGDFLGTRAEVEANIRRFGVIDRVDFIEGFFDVSLVALKDPIVAAFIDVDLASSTHDCLRHIWPLLAPGGVILTDDAADMKIAKVYFDDVWWGENLGCSAPGLIGAGCGAWVLPTNSPGQGYCRKPV